MVASRQLHMEHVASKKELDKGISVVITRSFAHTIGDKSVGQWLDVEKPSGWYVPCQDVCDATILRRGWSAQRST